VSRRLAAPENATYPLIFLSFQEQIEIHLNLPLIFLSSVLIEPPPKPNRRSPPFRPLCLLLQIRFTASPKILGDERLPKKNNASDERFFSIRLINVNSHQPGT